MDQNSIGLTYFKNTFPRIGDGPQVRESIQDVKFEDPLSEVKKKKTAWKSFKNITNNVPGDHNAENYRDVVADFVHSKNLRDAIFL